jgi:hypothetical protein
MKVGLAPTATIGYVTTIRIIERQQLVNMNSPNAALQLAKYFEVVAKSVWNLILQIDPPTNPPAEPIEPNYWL